MSHFTFHLFDRAVTVATLLLMTTISVARANDGEVAKQAAARVVRQAPMAIEGAVVEVQAEGFVRYARPVLAARIGVSRNRQPDVIRALVQPADLIEADVDLIASTSIPATSSGTFVGWSMDTASMAPAVVNVATATIEAGRRVAQIDF